MVIVQVSESLLSVLLDIYTQKWYSVIKESFMEEVTEQGLKCRQGYYMKSSAEGRNSMIDKKRIA